MVYHRTRDGKVISGRSPNPTSGDFFLLRSFTFTGTLHWTGDRRLVTGVGSNPKLVTFIYWRTDFIYYSGILNALKNTI